MPTFTKAELSEALHELGQFCVEAGKIIDIAIYGGSWSRISALAARMWTLSPWKIKPLLTMHHAKSQRVTPGPKIGLMMASGRILVQRLKVAKHTSFSRLIQMNPIRD